MAEQYATLTDYIGRTVDIAAFKGWKVNSHVKVTQALVMPGKSGELITGIEKLIQRYTIELLTEQGTLVYLPNRGTGFITSARQGFWRTTADVQDAFSLASPDMSRNLRGEESTSDPDDERFDSAKLLAVSLLGDEVTMSIKITSLAGSTFTAVLPITVTPF
tara:strand:- start:3969 stop:4454 length:486 start_codon:yes stop_codon:yes gene_type:complete